MCQHLKPSGVCLSTECTNSHSLLAIYLPQQQRVYFREGEEAEAIERESTRNTHLTARFKLNMEDPNAHQFLYTEIPHHYVFNNRDKRWVKRQRGGDRIISRMYSVSPADPEKFFLRMLLLHVPGATSYDNLKTVSGEVASTFREACIQMHLLADDTEYDEALTEASRFQMTIINSFGACLPQSVRTVSYQILCSFGLRTLKQ